MSSAQSLQPQAGFSTTDAPSPEALDHHGAGLPDAAMIARLANSFFQLQPNQNSALARSARSSYSAPRYSGRARPFRRDDGRSLGAGSFAFRPS